MILLNKTPLIFLFVISMLVSRAQTVETRITFFEGTFAEAVKRAKEEKKHIFFDAYASWCGPCKAMERDVFTNTAVADFFNANFVSVHMDMEKGEGPALAKRLTSIDGYPSLLFFSPDGHLNKTLLGSRSAEMLLQEAKLVVNQE